MSILKGLGPFVDAWLQVQPIGQSPYYRHKTAAKRLSRQTPIEGTLDFLNRSYQQIHNNWLAAKKNGYSKPSKENWRWKRHTGLSPKNTSPELLLEREIVNKCGEDWSNQMPAASGLVGPATDKRAAVDLVHREGPTKYSLIELKVDSNNPLFAAIEILQYGLLFVWSRNNLEKLGYDLHPQPVLAANEITLSVLAPGDYYSDYSLSNLTDALNNAFPDFKLRGDLILAFEFNRLGSELEIFPIESG